MKLPPVLATVGLVLASVTVAAPAAAECLGPDGLAAVCASNPASEPCRVGVRVGPTTSVAVQCG